MPGFFLLEEKKQHFFGPPLPKYPKWRKMRKRSPHFCPDLSIWNLYCNRKGGRQRFFVTGVSR